MYYTEYKSFCNNKQRKIRIQHCHCEYIIVYLALIPYTVKNVKF